ncbi:MAG: hypothetical protein ACRCSQ_10050 [Bacteroidales bacterium]
MRIKEIIRIIPVLFFSLSGSPGASFRINAAPPPVPTLNKPAAGNYQGATVSFTAVPDTQIRYRINATDWRTSDSPLQITLFYAPVTIECLAINKDGESPSVIYTVETLRNTTPCVITNSITIAGEEQCFAVSSDAKKSDPATELYGVVAETTPDNEILIDNPSVIWHAETNKENAGLIGSNGSYLYVVRAGQTNLGYRNNIFYWHWNEKSKIYEYNDGSTTRMLMYGTGSPGGFKAFASGNFNKPGYASGSARFPVEKVCIGGATHDSRINYLLSLKTLRSLDLRKALLPEGGMISGEYGNPNCLVFTANPMNLPANEICDKVCERLALSDGGSLGIGFEFIAREASYTRMTREDGGWETILIPFEVKESEMPSDYLFYGFESLSADEKTVNFTRVTSLCAHTSYLMRYNGWNNPEKTKELLLHTADARITVQKETKTFNGVYKETETDGKYILGQDLSGKPVFRKGDANSFVLPFRAYLDLPLQSETLLIAPFPDIPDRIATTGETDWTFINPQPGVLMIKCGSTLAITLTGIDGRMVRRGTLPAGEHRLEGLSGGVYFLNGKKIMLD